MQNKKTRIREERSLLRADTVLGHSRGMILTEDIQEIFETDGVVRYYPVWK